MIVFFELSREYFEWLRVAIESQKADDINVSLKDANPADIASLLDNLNTDESKYVLSLLNEEKAAEVITYLEENERKELLKVIQPTEVARYIKHIDSDDAADILNDLSVKFKEKVIAAIDDEEQAAYILELMKYDEDCAGGLMAKELIRANVNWTVAQTIEEIRRQKENVEKVYSIYVVDDQNRLLGIIPLKNIILSNDDTRIADIYDPDIVSVETYMDKKEVAAIMQKYDMEVSPVVNIKGKLVGRITVDDILDVITEMADEERQIMSGISEDVEEDDSVLVLTRARLPWLVIGMIGGLIGAQIIEVFEESIVLIPAMAFFIPLITATGGNVGIQSSSIVVQSLASNQQYYGSVFNRLLKVLLVALINGLALGVAVFAINHFVLGYSDKIAAIVSIALFSVVLLASFLGTIVPLILEKFGINPAVASGPFITTANDILGLAVYFTVAHMLV